MRLFLSIRTESFSLKRSFPCIDSSKQSEVKRRTTPRYGFQHHLLHGVLVEHALRVYFYNSETILGIYQFKVAGERAGAIFAVPDRPQSHYQRAQPPAKPVILCIDSDGAACDIHDAVQQMLRHGCSFLRGILILDVQAE